MLNKDKLILNLFRVITITVLIGFIISEFVLPSETDAAFSKDMSDTEDVLLDYPQPVFWVHEDGSREEIEIPGRYKVEPGTVMTLESVLPEIKRATRLILRSSQQTMRIYINDELHVDYDTKDTRPFGTQTTSRYVFCRLDPKDSGATVRVELTSNSRSYSGTVNPIYIGSKHSFWGYHFDEYGSNLVFGLVIIIFGICTIVLSVCFNIFLREEIRLEYVGWCALLTGLWLVGESRFRQLLVPNNTSMSNLCFIIIMLAPIPISLYLNRIQSGRYAKRYHGLCCIALVNLGICMILQLTNTYNFLETMIVSHVILILTFVTACITFYSDKRKGELKNYRWECAGLLVVLAMVSIESISTYFTTIMVGGCLMVGILVLIAVSVSNEMKQVGEQRRQQELERFREEKRKSDQRFKQLIQMVSFTLESKDEYKNGHSQRVAEYTKKLAKKLGYDDEAIDKLYYATSLHDIGKIAVPDAIQNKPTVLNEDEFRVVKMHPIVGEDILKRVDLAAYSAPIARSHHERYDGNGYPDGLSGEAIPYEARMVALADSYDAMNSRRSYRPPMSREAIRREIEQESGRQFDPEIAKVFLELLDAGELETKEETAVQNDYENTGINEQVISFIMDTFDNKTGVEGLDLVTGLPTRGVGEKTIANRMKEVDGALAFVDMDNLKKINDIHGHKAGDRALKLLGNVLDECGDGSYACRIGGDEFLLFIERRSETNVTERIESIIKRFEAEKKADSSIVEATLSVGICVCRTSDDFTKVMENADKALYYVKQRGKNGYYYYHKAEMGARKSEHTIGLDHLVNAIKNAGKYEGAMDIEFRGFSRIYEYISNLSERYGYDCYLVMVTLESQVEEMTDIDRFESSVDSMKKAISENIRSVDIYARYSSVQYLVILYEASDQNIDKIMQRIFKRYDELNQYQEIVPTYVMRKI